VRREAKTKRNLAQIVPRLEHRSESGAHAQLIQVAVHRAAGAGAKESAQVKNGGARCARQVRQRDACPKAPGHRLARAVDDLRLPLAV
jgi:hypothetical protein